MPRKKRSSPAEDIIALAALLPWWLALGLAVTSYLSLHWYVDAHEIGKAVKQTDMAGLMIGQLLRTGARIGQYLLPFLLLIGAVVSGVGRRRRAALLGTVASGDSREAMSALYTMTWHEFELVVGEWFRTNGYNVSEHGGNGPDGGIDLVLDKGNERFLVQCKQWRANKVGVTIVRELYGVMAAQGATGGFVITAGVFTDDARHFAAGRNVTLIDGVELARMMREVCSVSTGRDAAAQVPVGLQRPKHGFKPCPICSSEMVERVAKRGTNAGQHFWGCSNYPACKGTLSA